ncbi:5'-nucleotidase [Hyalangium rubrum]|uniref:5'-nucleotidase n=1 Tax=Hyalangium rubrum TaxID=3103134 RepID=A0ABU5HAP9_9BACT|nr:5'-nucleotidase [Hyalangium sp. s54d21]MDY7230553.1 5'-nucleotidase [Hyalangium sp. s54d21]
MPVLVLDAGNALFKFPTAGGEPTEEARAKLLLQQMDAMGTSAMAVGTRDLVRGVDFLRKHGKVANLKLLSANLLTKEGKKAFPASTVLTAGELKVGVVGVSPEGGVGDAIGQPPIPAALAEAKRLRQTEKVDVVVVLAALPHTMARQLAQQGEGVDFVVQSGDGRGPGMASKDGFATLVPPGERGRQLARLELSVNGAGPFADLSTVSRDQERLKMLESNLTRAKERLSATKDETSRRALEESITSLETQRATVQKALKGGATGSARTHLLSYTSLGADVPSDAAVQKLVEAIEPPGSAHH